MNKFLGVLAVIFLLGICTEGNKDVNDNMAVGFVVTMIALVLLNAF